MKLIKAISIPILIILFISVAVCFGQTNYKTQKEIMETIEKGKEYGSQGKFKEAKDVFEKSLEDNNPRSNAKHLKIIE